MNQNILKLCFCSIGHMIIVSFAFVDISLERKGDGGESIYGPTFEGTYTV